MEACDLGELALRNLLEALLRNSLRKDGDRGGLGSNARNPQEGRTKTDLTLTGLLIERVELVGVRAVD
jgi:hypothetical protein